MSPTAANWRAAVNALRNGEVLSVSVGAFTDKTPSDQVPNAEELTAPASVVSVLSVMSVTGENTESGTSLLSESENPSSSVDTRPLEKEGTAPTLTKPTKLTEVAGRADWGDTITDAELAVRRAFTVPFAVRLSPARIAALETLAAERAAFSDMAHRYYVRRMHARLCDGAPAWLADAFAVEDVLVDRARYRRPMRAAA